MSYLQKTLQIAAIMAIMSSTSFANTTLYFSNNQSVITPEVAFTRLESSPETQLEKQMVPVLQQAHVEQGQTKEVLGLYQMSQDQQITADNSIAFSFSPYQTLENSTIRSIAQSLAEKFNQDSVALVKTDKNSGTIIDRQVCFNHNKPYLIDLISQIKEQLPDDYQIAYTIYIDGHPGTIENARVEKIEWIGKNLSTQELQDVFNQSTIKEYKGQAWLIYKDGRVQAL